MGSDSSPLSAFAAKHGVKYFLVAFVDLFGVVRSKLVPAAAIADTERNGAGFGGFATYLDMSPMDPDLLAVPDASSAVVLPWKPEVAWVAGDLVVAGKPFMQGPRNVLKEQVSRAKAEGYVMKSGVECEFFLLSSTSPPSIADASDTADKPCYDQDALMRKYDVIAELCDHMQTMGWKPYQNDHEDANGQFEMNWEYDNCLVTADRHVFFKFMAKSVAAKHGMRATFMPKPFSNRTGNGAHCHVSLWREDNETNLFFDDTDEMGLSSLAYHFMGGVLSNAKALSAISNPTVNSYKRIDGTSTASGSSWAPCSISFTGNNRTHMMRIPDKGRFELRLPDGAANPYLLQAALLASGLHGIATRQHPGERCDWNGHLPNPPKVLPTLPENLLDALRCLKESEVFRKTLGGVVVDAYVNLKMISWKEYCRHLSSWEIETTIDC